MPMAAPAPVGRPPKAAQPRTPALASSAAQQTLSPISTKVAMLPKEAGALGNAGRAVARAGKRAKNRVLDLADDIADKFRKDPPPPQLSGMSAGAAGAGIGALGLGAAGALKAKDGDRMDSFARNAVLGAGLGGAAGLVSKGPVNEILAQRHTNKLVAARTKAREARRAARRA